MSLRTMRFSISTVLIAVWALMAAMPQAAFAQGNNQIASDEPPFYCPHKDGAFYQKGLFPRYLTDSHTLVLVDAQTNQSVRTLDTFPDNVRMINWSPDCRYLSGAVGKIRYARRYNDSLSYVSWNSWGIFLWDAVNGGRIHSVGQMAGSYPSAQPVIWSPLSDYALLLSGCTRFTISCQTGRQNYDFLWRRESNSSFRLGQLPIGKVGNAHSPYKFELENKGLFNTYRWDMTRGWIWGNDLAGVVAYDLHSGVETIWFPSNLGPDFKAFSENLYEFSPDDTKVVVFSTTGDSGTGNEAHGMTVYDIATRQGVSVNVESFAAPYTPFPGYHPVALSPDNRYLVAGYTALRVWDLQNLPENLADRLPIYRHAGPEDPILQVRFVAPTVVETGTRAGKQKWDIITGKMVP